jgi:hypothetical protein
VFYIIQWREDLEKWQLPRIQGRSEFKSFKGLPSLTSGNSRGEEAYHNVNNNVNGMINDEAKKRRKKKKPQRNKRRKNESNRENINGNNGEFVDVDNINVSNEWWNENFNNDSGEDHYAAEEFEDEDGSSHVSIQNETISKQMKQNIGAGSNCRSSRQRRRRKRRERSKQNAQAAYKTSPIQITNNARERRGLKPRTPHRDNDNNKNFKNVMLRPLNNIVDPPTRLMVDNDEGPNVNNVLPSPSNMDNNDKNGFSRVLEPINNCSKKKKNHHRPRPPKNKKNTMQNQNPRSSGGHLTVKLGAIQNANSNVNNNTKGKSSNLIAFPAGDNNGKNSNTISLNAVFTFHQPVGNQDTGNNILEKNDPS